MKRQAIVSLLADWRSALFAFAILLLAVPAFAQSAPTAGQPSSPDEFLWRGIQSQTSAGVFELFLNLYPDSQYATQAKLKLNAITRVAGETWAGFKSLRSAPLPKKIDKDLIRKTVFRIETFDAASANLEIFDTSKARRRPLRGKKYGTPAFARAVQIASCVHQKIRKCPILGQITGTAFAVDDRSTMVTARHVMGSWAQEAAKINPGLKFGDIVQPFLLFDADNRLIYNSAVDKQRPKLRLANTYPVPDRFIDNELSMENQLYGQSDYMEIAFDIPVFKSNLVRSQTDVEKSISSIYVVGYPDLTQFYKINTYLKPKGAIRDNTLSISAGRFQGRLDAVYVTNAYAFNGMSGGPALDAQGQVLGVFFAMRDGRNTGSDVFEKSFFVTTDKKLLTETWNTPKWRDLLAAQKVTKSAP